MTDIWRVEPRPTPPELDPNYRAPAYGEHVIELLDNNRA